MYRDARKRAGLTREEAAFRLHVAPRTLAKYESGETVPPPEVALKMAETYRASQLTAAYCRYECPIGQKYSYEVLNNVDLSPVAILTKFIDEKQEVDALLNELMVTVLNKNGESDLNLEEKAKLEKATLELLDLEHVIETLKLQLWRFLNIGKLIKKHNEKCKNKGYVDTKKDALSGAK